MKPERPRNSARALHGQQSRKKYDVAHKCDFKALCRSTRYNVIHDLRLAEHLFGKITLISAIARNIGADWRNMNIQWHHLEATLIILASRSTLRYCIQAKPPTPAAARRTMTPVMMIPTTLPLLFVYSSSRYQVASYSSRPPCHIVSEDNRAVTRSPSGSSIGVVFGLLDNLLGFIDPLFLNKVFVGRNKWRCTRWRPDCCGTCTGTTGTGTATAVALAVASLTLAPPSAACSNRSCPY